MGYVFNNLALGIKEILNAVLKFLKAAKQFLTLFYLIINLF